MPSAFLRGCAEFVIIMDVVRNPLMYDGGDPKTQARRKPFVHGAIVSSWEALGPTSLLLRTE